VTADPCQPAASDDLEARLARLGLPARGVQDRQAALPRALREFHRRRGPRRAGDPHDHARTSNFYADARGAGAYRNAHPGMAGELLGQAEAVEAARRVFGGLLDPEPDRDMKR